MADLLVQVMSFPMSGFFYGMDWMIRTMRDVQGASAAGLSRTMETFSGTVGTATNFQEEMRMINRDQDLSGDDLKLVRYRILFIKREYEAAFPEEDDLVSYSIPGTDWAGIKVAEFMERAKEGGVPVPAKWQRLSYPPSKPGIQGWVIPEEDRQYVRMYFEVVQRIEREKAEYDREQVKVLREISRKIG
jgi:beta-mannanase